MTRARRHLQLIVPQRFYVTQQRRQGNRHLYGGRSRFIPDSLLPLFDADGPAERAREQALAVEARARPTDPATAGPASAPAFGLVGRIAVFGQRGYAARPIVSVTSPTPSMRPSMRSPGSTGPTPSGVPV